MENEKNEKLTADKLASLPQTPKKEEKPKTADFLERENERLKAKLYQMEKDQEYLKGSLERAQDEKRKPGIQVVEADGEYRKKKRVNSSGLSDLMLPPYTKNQVAIYKIIGTADINPATGLAVEPVDTLVPGRYTLHDRFETDPLKKDKIMKNVIGTEQVVNNGKLETKETIEDIVFVRGWLQVPVKEKYGLYVFMELHPMNKSNKFRPSNAAVAFERVDIQHLSSASKNMNTELALDAGNAVRDLKKDDVLAYCMTCVPPIQTAGRPFNEVKGDLIRYAMNNPIPFFKQNKNIKAAIAITVTEALMFGIITYRPQHRMYVNAETEETICVHTVQEDPEEALVKFLAKEEHAEVYKNIVDRLHYWNDED